MRKGLKDGWYCTSEAGPMAQHVPGFVTELAWDDRMGALQPVDRPEAPGASRPEDAQWASADAGKTYVEVVDGRAAHVQYSGTGHILGSKVRHNAEVFLHQWLDIPEEFLHRAAANGVPIPCWPSEVPATHLFVWVPKVLGPWPKLPPTLTPMRVEGPKAYNHVEWLHRSHPKCHPNWVLENGRWFWRDPTGKLYPTPANRPGQLQILAAS